MPFDYAQGDIFLRFTPWLNDIGVTLQPGLLGQISISFSGLLSAETLVPKPDSSGSLRFKHQFMFYLVCLLVSQVSIGATANGGTENLQEPQATHFLIRISFISVGETPTDRIKTPISIIWSARPVQNNKFLPVLRFYASLPRTSLLQGIAATGAK